MDEVLLTIFTPTYNRSYILSQLYDSLCRQTIKSFQWLIIDDGSTDETNDLIIKWKLEGKIKIDYLKQENSGKMIAFNKAVDNAKGTFFFCVDSDDYLTDNAIQIILENVVYLDREDTIGLIAYKGTDEISPLMNSEFPNLKFIKLGQLYENGFRGDTSIIFKTMLIKKYKFPYIKGEKFMPEEYIYDQIDQYYLYYLVPKVLTICEYLEDGYSKNTLKLLKNNPKNYKMFWDQKIRYSSNLKKSMLSSIRYAQFCFQSHDYSFSEKMNMKKRILILLLYPAGFLLYLIRLRSYKKIKEA